MSQPEVYAQRDASGRYGLFIRGEGELCDRQLADLGMADTEEVYRLARSWNWWMDCPSLTLVSIRREDLVKALAEARDALSGDAPEGGVRPLQLQLDALVELLSGTDPRTPGYSEVKPVPAGPTPGPWREGRAGGSIVADTGQDNAGTIAYYGGHVIAETVSSRNRSLIIAAPDLYGIVRRFVEMWTRFKLRCAGHAPMVVVEHEHLLDLAREALALADHGRQLALPAGPETTEAADVV